MKKQVKTKSKFLKVICSKCKNEQIIFNKASTNVKCLVCEAKLSSSKGGKTKVRSKVVQVLE